jgi:hypothetical protein
MLTASVVFFWDCQPRETVSGLLGRWKVKGGTVRRAVAVPLAWLVDRIYWWEPDHCVKIYREEHEARLALYQDWPHP